jgi:hypothetical protein
MVPVELNATQIVDYTQETNGIGAASFEGFFFALPNLPGNNSLTNLQLQVKLKPSVAPYTYGEILANVFIEGLYEKQWQLIQRRMTPLRCEPTFMPIVASPQNPAVYTQAVLVTTSATTQTQFKVWMDLLTGTFGLCTAVFSLSRYGAFGPTKVWMEGPQFAEYVKQTKAAGGNEAAAFAMQGNLVQLQTFLAGKGILVVVLDDEFEVDRGHDARASSLAIQGWETRTYVHLPGGGGTAPTYLVVGSSPTRAFYSSPHLKALRKRIPAIQSGQDAYRGKTYESLQEFYQAVGKGQVLWHRGDLVEIPKDASCGDAVGVGVVVGSEQKRDRDCREYLVRSLAVSHRVVPVKEANLRQCSKDQLAKLCTRAAMSSHWQYEEADPMLEYRAITVQDSGRGSTAPYVTQREGVLTKKAHELEKWLRRYRPELEFLLVPFPWPQAKVEMVASGCTKTTWNIGEIRVFSMTQHANKYHMPRVLHMVPDSSRAAYKQEGGVSVVNHRRAGGWHPASLVYGVTKGLCPQKQLQALVHVHGTGADEQFCSTAVSSAILETCVQELFAFIDSRSSCCKESVLQFMPTLRALHGAGKDILKQLAKSTSAKLAATHLLTGLVAATKAPGCHRWFKPFGRFRRCARQVRKIVEKNIAKTWGISVDKKKLLPKFYTQMNSYRKDRSRGMASTSRDAAKLRFCAEGFVQFELDADERAKSKQAHVKSVLGLLDEAVDAAEEDRVVSVAEFNACSTASYRSLRQATQQCARVVDKRRTYLVEEEEKSNAPGGTGGGAAGTKGTDGNNNNTAEEEAFDESDAGQAQWASVRPTFVVRDHGMYPALQVQQATLDFEAECKKMQKQTGDIEAGVGLAPSDWQAQGSMLGAVAPGKAVAPSAPPPMDEADKDGGSGSAAQTPATAAGSTSVLSTPSPDSSFQQAAASPGIPEQFAADAVSQQHNLMHQATIGQQQQAVQQPPVAQATMPAQVAVQQQQFQQQPMMAQPPPQFQQQPMMQPQYQQHQMQQYYQQPNQVQQQYQQPQMQQFPPQQQFQQPQMMRQYGQGSVFQG